MACRTIVNGMPLRQREEIVVEAFGCPIDGVDEVAIGTFGRKAAGDVVGIGCGHILILMTIVTLDSNGIKSHER